MLNHGVKRCGHFHVKHLRDRQQITFVTLNKFCPLSKPPPLSLTENVKLMEYQPKLDEKSSLFHTAFQVLKTLLIKNYKTQLLVLLFVVVLLHHQLLDLTTLTNFFCSHAGMVLLQGPCWSTIFWTCAGNSKTVIYVFPYPLYQQ